MSDPVSAPADAAPQVSPVPGEAGPDRPTDPPVVPPKSPKKRRQFVIALAVAAAIAGGAFGFRWWQAQRDYASTNDAAVKADIVAISAKIPGRLATVHVSTGQRVRLGQLVAHLDDSDARLQVQQAEAALAAATAGLGSADTGVALQREQATAQEAQAAAALAAARRNHEAARVARDRAATDLGRSERVYREGGLSRQAIDAARAARATAEAQMQAAEAQVRSAMAGSDLAASGRTQVRLREQAVVTTRAQIAQAEAALATARQQLVHTRVLAPVDGEIVRVALNPGEMAQPGQVIASVVADGSLRVEAFLEETKVRNVRPGQPVEVELDAFPGRSFRGRITTIGAAAGSEFALIPQNNASGNFTKVVQRLPIRIAVEDPERLLRAGLSATVHIDVRETR